MSNTRLFLEGVDVTELVYIQSVDYDLDAPIVEFRATQVGSLLLRKCSKINIEGENWRRNILYNMLTWEISDSGMDTVRCEIHIEEIRTYYVK